MDRALVEVGQKGRFPKIVLNEPSAHGFLLVAIEIDHRPLFGFVWESRCKRKLLGGLKDWAREAPGRHGVREATVFKAFVRPPGGGELERFPQVRPAAFDVVMLIETDTPDQARLLAELPEISTLVQQARDTARRVEVITASNARRIAPVRHDRGVFLFNWFYARSEAQNLAVWEYTAGWFADQTGLDNSTLLRPDPGTTEYTIVNHCRWEHLSDVLPSLLFKPSFRNYVLAHFSANDTVPMPILYRLA